MAVSTLYDYYTAKGQSLPSLSARAQLYQQLGLGTAADYISKNKAGDATPNNALLAKLTGGFSLPADYANYVSAPTTPATSTPAAKYSAPSASATPAPATPTSNAAFLAEQAKKAEEEKAAKLAEQARIDAETSATKGTTTTATKEGLSTTAPAPISQQKALLLSIADANANATLASKPPATVAEALALAAKDPNIISKYADAAAIDNQTFLQNIENLRLTTGIQSEQQKTQFENERLALAEKASAYGQAYSGFRNKATENLAASESQVVQSSRAQAQQSLNQLVSSFESKYGTGAAKNMTTTLPFYNPLSAATITPSGLTTTAGSSGETITAPFAGGITGSSVTGKNIEIQNLAASNPDIYSPAK